MPEADRPIKTNNATTTDQPHENYLPILTTIIGLASFAQAGPNYPGFIFQQPPAAKKIVRAAQPTGPQCTMKRTEVVDFGGRRSGPGYAVSKTVNCTGQKCCATPAAMAKAGCSTMK